MKTPKYQQIIGININIKQILKNPLGVVIMDLGMIQISNLLSTLEKIPDLVKMFIAYISCKDISMSIRNFITKVKILSNAQKTFAFLDVIGTIISLADIGINT
jgi:choline-glycine betaine transporter